MKKSFFTKLITYILAFMIFLNGILPTNFVYAKKEDDPNEGYMEFTVDVSDWYTFSEYTGGNNRYSLVEHMKNVYYYNDDNEKVYPEFREEEKNAIGATTVLPALYLEEGVTYYREDSFFTKGAIIERDQDDASLIEGLITRLFLLIGSGLYALVCLVVGENFSIEKVIFNDYSNTKLGFFNGSEPNTFIEEAGIKTTLNDFYNFFSGITLAVYLIILVYMGVKILLGSTAEKGSKYKQLIIYWLEGVLILFLFPYVMKYSIQINDAFVSFVYANKNQSLAEISDSMPEVQFDSENELKDVGNMIGDISEEMKTKTDYMSIMYNEAMNKGWLVLAICWYVMFFQMIGFLIVYFKRVLVVLFLIAVFPLVMISYAIDKIGDAKSQAFGNWVKEFMMNVFLQSFHVIAYVLIMSTIGELIDDPQKNWLLILIAMTFVSNGDDMLRAIFSIDKGAGSVKGIGSTIAEAAAIRAISNGLRGAKDRLIGEKSAARKVYNKASNLSQKAWNKADNRVRATAEKIELEKMPQVVDLANMQSAEDIENVLKGDIKTLLNKKNVSDEEFRSAADRMLGAVNQTNNAEVQDVLKRLMSQLSPAEKAKLMGILDNNATINGIMVGGREVNITQNVNIILQRINDEKNRTGKISDETNALLGKLVDSEGEFRSNVVYGNMKFKQDKNSNKSKSKSMDSHGRYPSSRSKSSRGRNAAKNRRGIAGAKNSLEYAMKRKRSGSDTKTKVTPKATTAIDSANAKLSGPQKTENKKLKLNTSSIKSKKNSPEYKDLNLKNREGNLQTSKGGTKVDTFRRIAATMGEGENDSPKSTSTTNYGNKVPQKKGLSSSADNKNILTVRDAQKMKQAVMDMQKNKVKPKGNITAAGGNTSFQIKRDAEKTSKEQKINVSATQTSSSARPSASNTRQNVGADIANKSGSANDLINVLNRDTYKAKGNEIFENMLKNNGSLPNESLDMLYKNASKNMNFNVNIDDRLHRDREYVFKDKAYSNEAKKDFESAIKSINILNTTNSGNYTAKEILRNVESLKEKVRKYENASVDERMGMEDITKLLPCNLDDYEAALRVKILNNPDSVGNDRKIIEESKAYVKNIPLYSSLKNKLGYNLEDLKEGQNLKYVRVKDTSNVGMISESHRTKMQEEYDLKLRRTELERDIEKRDKDDKEKYGAKSFVKDTVELGGAALAFGADTLISTVYATGTGFIGTGMSTTGKKETLTEATTNFFGGMSVTNDIYDKTKKSIKEFREDTKESFKKDIKGEKSNKTNKSKNNKTSEPIEYYKDKTRLRNKNLFSNENDEN